MGAKNFPTPIGQPCVESWKVLAERPQRRRWWWWTRTKNNKSPVYPGWLNHKETKIVCLILVRYCITSTLHKGHGISNHQPANIKQTSKLCITGPLWGNPPVTGGFPHKGPVIWHCFHVMRSSWHGKLCRQPNTACMIWALSLSCVAHIPTSIYMCICQCHV